MARIYLDNQATTPMDPAVLDAMLPYFTGAFGNAASRSHAYGWEAAEAVEVARELIARGIGAGGTEIVFTSGATESINLAIKGVAESYQAKGRHLITTAVEHSATLDTCRYLERQGCEVTYLPVDETGLVSPTSLEAALRPDTLLVSVLHGNNEIGTLAPVAELGRITRAAGALFHVDAAQTFGKVPLDVEAMHIDLLSLSAHKVYGPKGVGALYVRRRAPRVKLAPQIHGGGHERGMRSGTLNVPGIVGFGKAAAIATAVMAEEAIRVAALRERLYARLCEGLDGVHLNGHPIERLPGNLNVRFDFVESEALIAALHPIALSSGSACTSATLAPSHVLRACGLSEEQAYASVRFGLGRFTTEAEVDEAASAAIAQVKRLRELSPLYAMWKDGLPIEHVRWATP